MDESKVSIQESKVIIEESKVAEKESKTTMQTSKEITLDEATTEDEDESMLLAEFLKKHREKIRNSDHLLRDQINKTENIVKSVTEAKPDITSLAHIMNKLEQISKGQENIVGEIRDLKE